MKWPARPANVFRRAGECVLYLGGTLLRQVLELRLPGQHGVHRAQQPVEREVVAGGVPLLEPDLHRIAPFRPLRADLREGKVALGELGATAVHPFEGVDYHVERLVRAGDFLNVQVHVNHTEKPAQAPDVVADLGRQRRLLREAPDELAQPRGALLHQLGHVGPQRIALHLHRLVELESLGLQMKAQCRERLGVAIKELWRPPTHHTVQGGHALLAVEHELHHPRGKRAVTTMRGGLRLGGPHQEPANRMAAVERVEQTAHLIAVPDVAALELGQSHVPAVDVVEDGGDLHISLVLPVSSSCIMACLRSRVLSRRTSSADSSASMSERTAAMATCSCLSRGAKTANSSNRSRGR